MKQGARSEKQRRGVTTITVITAEQNIVGDGVPATWSSGRGESRSVEELPAAKKKDVDNEFPVEIN